MSTYVVPSGRRVSNVEPTAAERAALRLAVGAEHAVARRIQRRTDRLATRVTIVGDPQREGAVIAGTLEREHALSTHLSTVPPR